MRLDRYAHYFVIGHSVHTRRDRVTVRWLSDGHTRATSWHYQGQVIAVLLTRPDQAQWFYLRAPKPAQHIFKRFNLLLARLNFMDKFTKHKKHWNFAALTPWPGQMLFFLSGKSINRPRSLPTVAGRLSELWPKNFSNEPFSEKV